MIDDCLFYLESLGVLCLLSLRSFILVSLKGIIKSLVEHIPIIVWKTLSSLLGMNDYLVFISLFSSFFEVKDNAHLKSSSDSRVRTKLKLELIRIFGLNFVHNRWGFAVVSSSPAVFNKDKMLSIFRSMSFGLFWRASSSHFNLNITFYNRKGFTKCKTIIRNILSLNFINSD